MHLGVPMYFRKEGCIESIDDNVQPDIVHRQSDEPFVIFHFYFLSLYL